LIVGICSAWLAHGAQVEADDVRRSVDVQHELQVLPNGELLRVAVSGYQEVAADILWIRAVLLFGERWGNDDNESWSEWFVGMVEAIRILDPEWRTPYFYGGAMMRLLGEIDAADRLFLFAMEQMPDDSFFPFAYGMNQYLERGDVEEAAKWVRLAAEKPGAPKWYREATAGLLADKGMREQAIRFLQSEMEMTTEPKLYASLEQKLLDLLHDEAVEQIGRVRASLEKQRSASFTSLEEFEAVAPALPSDPLGGPWVFALDGVIRSSVREELLLERTRRMAWKLLEPGNEP
jgi:tetratricopeptide (TPR) repeat protein